MSLPTPYYIVRRLSQGCLPLEDITLTEPEAVYTNGVLEI